MVKFASMRESDALRLWAKLCKLWIVAFVVFLFPLYLVYQLDTMLLCVPPLEIAVNSSVMLAFLVLLGLIPGSLSGLVGLPLGSWRLLVYRLNVLIVLVLIGFDLSRTGKMWLKSAFGISFAAPFALKALFVAACLGLLVLAAYKGFAVFAWVESIVNGLFRPVMAIFALASIVSVGWMAFHGATVDCRPCQGFPDSPPNLSAEAGNGAAEKPDIIFVTFDALSADDMSLYGFELKTTPSIDSLASESYVFDRMFSNSNWTRPTVTSIFTGLYPSTHKVFGGFVGDTLLKDETRTLPWVLRKAGYRTLAVVNNYGHAHPYTTGTFRSFDLCPWENFDVRKIRREDPGAYLRFYGAWLSGYGLQAHYWASEWIEHFTALLPKSRRYETVTSFPADRTFEYAGRLMKEVSGPKFLWIHLFPPHSPYLPPAPYRGAFLKGDELSTTTAQWLMLHKDYPPEKQAGVDKLRMRHDEFMQYADHEFGRFVESLKASGEWDKAIVIVSSDHGESFTHGYVGHGNERLYQSLIHIPLIIHLPGAKEGKRVKSNAEEVDIAPTLLDLVGVGIPEWMEGESLEPAMRGSLESAKPKFSMQLQGNSKFGRLRTGTIAVVKGPFKLIYWVETGKTELYNLDLDPGETKELSGTEKETTESLKDLVMQRIVQKY